MLENKKNLIFNDLSPLILLIVIFFKLLRFNIFYINLDKKLRKKIIIAFLKKLNIVWINYQDYKIDNIQTEQLKLSPKFSDYFSKKISHKFWSKNLQKLYLKKDYFSACLNFRVWSEAQNIIEILTVGKIFQKKNTKTYVWIKRNKINREINKKYFNIRNINFLPNIYFLEILKTISLVSNFIFKAKKRKIPQSKFETKKNTFDKFTIGMFPHQGIYYSDLYIKDQFYSNNKKDPFYHNKILHLEWSKKDLDDRSERFYKKKKIQIVYWDELADNKEPILLLLKFLKSNFRWLTSIIFYDIQVTVQILTSIYLRYKSECKLKKFDKLKLILVCYDVLFLNEIAVACKKLKIATLSIQDRLISSSWSPSMIFDHYFVIGPKSKKILKDRMYKKSISNLHDHYLQKIEKYQFNKKSISRNNKKNSLKCLIIDWHSFPKNNWYSNGRSGVRSWRMNKNFYRDVELLSKKFKKINFYIKGKDYEWIKNPYFNEILVKIKKSKNIFILNDKIKWTPEYCIKKMDFAIARYSSLADEMLAINKPVIVYSLAGNPSNFFNFGSKLNANNFFDVEKKLNEINKNFNKYNYKLNSDRQKLFFKFKSNSLKDKLNKIYGKKV